MRQYLNLPDLLLVGLSAFVVIWGANKFLRSVGASDLQA